MTVGGRPEGPAVRRAGAARAAGVALASVLALAALAALAAAPGPASAQEGRSEMLRMTTARQVGGERAVRMKVEFGAGELLVEPAEEGLLYQAALRYDGSVFEPIRSYGLSDGVATVELGMKGEADGAHFDFDWEDLDLGDLHFGELGDGERGRLEVGISRSVPTELEVLTGATSGELRLGGVPLTRFRLATGASETTVSFEEPNPRTMGHLEVKAGAASLEVRRLGNAHAEEMRFEGAVGDVLLDFTGEWRGDAHATVKMGLGSLRLRIPEELGVQVRKSSLLSSFSGLGLRKAGDGSYRTANWSSAEHHLSLEVDAAFGSIDVEVVP